MGGKVCSWDMFVYGLVRGIALFFTIWRGIAIVAIKGVGLPL